MKKTLRSENGELYRQLSRWITINNKCVTPRHRLYDFADGGFDGVPVLDYFVFKGKEYALNQFMRLAWPDDDGDIILEDGTKLVAYDALGAYNPVRPLLVELDERIPAVRLWQRVNVPS